jgi:predicted secreted protein
MWHPDVLIERLDDERSRKVVFLSHCLLNENTRYLGGACRTCCVREVVEQCMDRDIGMVQMPCPEQQVWGGVLKRKMLWIYGKGRASRVANRLVKALLPLGLLYVRRAFRNMARNVAVQIEDYLSSGFIVLGIVGIDGSPTCGVHKTIDSGAFLDDVTRIDPASLSRSGQNELVRRHVSGGRGVFMDELAGQLRIRELRIPLLAHDLLGELQGFASNLVIGGDDHHRT